MILFLNGAFGVGKTTVAEMLAARRPGSLLYDPEEVGYFLRRILPAGDQPADFQDIPLWRTLAVHTARELRAGYGRDLIVPMTIWHPPYFLEVTGGLREIDPQFYHFCLTATPATLHTRLQRRGDPPGSFAWNHVASCVPAFQLPLFARQIATDDRSPDAIVAAILEALPAG